VFDVLVDLADVLVVNFCTPSPPLPPGLRSRPGFRVLFKLFQRVPPHVADRHPPSSAIFLTIDELKARSWLSSGRTMRMNFCPPPVQAKILF